MKQKSLSFAAFSAIALASSAHAVTTIYLDDFNDQQNIDRGGPYPQGLVGSAPTIRNAVLGGSATATWSGSNGGSDFGGWGQRDLGDNNVATPTTSNFLPFSPVAGYDYTVSVEIDTTPLGGGDPGNSGSWFALAFTPTLTNWNPAFAATINEENLVRWNSNTSTTMTYTVSGADLVAAGVQYVGWMTDWAGVVNMSGSTQVKLDNFSLTAVPEPSAALLGGLGMLALLRRRR